MTNSNATVGFVGILIGSLITGTATWLAVRENRKLQWSHAALEKRLAVHQEAYSEWKKIMGAVCGGEDIFNTVINAEKWLSMIGVKAPPMIGLKAPVSEGQKGGLRRDM